MRLDQLTEALADKYEAFLATCPDSLTYQSWRYGQMLRAVLREATPRYFLALDSAGDILGALPCFVSSSGPIGPVLNSLPFCGSHGGALAKNDDPKVKLFLLKSMDAFAQESGCAAATVIASPFERHEELFADLFDSDLQDERISLITPLPSPDVQLEDKLMSSFHSIRRNDIRRAQRAGVRVEPTVDKGDLDFLSRVHGESMASVGGPPKPQSFYDALGTAMLPGVDWKCYRATVDGECIAALLVLFGNGTAEYFVPAILPERRTTQAMALTIFSAMKDAARSGCHRWNWGGSGRNIGGVYNFKNKWGTREGRYLYHTKLYAKGRALLGMTQEQIMGSQPPWFYVLPFHRLSPTNGPHQTECA